jgi:metallo-beta-lactamase family protein
MKPQLQFHGATQEVTGSMHVIHANGHSVALDCGLHQGRRAESNQKNRSWPTHPSKIDAVVLSHAHIDHIGKLPKLVADGFEGNVYGTPATLDLARILLADSAHIQKEDAEYWNKKRVKKGDEPIEPLYTQDDVDATMQRLQPIRLRNEKEVMPGITVRLHEAGHMLGSAGTLVTVDGQGSKPTRIVYTGDLGRPNTAILRDPAPLPECDYLICESTYGGRESPDPQDMPDRFRELLNKAIDRGGKIVVPAFAVGRTQTIVYLFHQMLEDQTLRKAVPLIVDSPLASAATQIFAKHADAYDEEASAFHKLAGSLFKSDWCEYTQNVEDSKALHGRAGPMIIVSASGMCEAGRILHHLKNNVEDPRNTVLIVGFQAQGTLGRRIADGAKEIRIFGETYEVRAPVRSLRGFSAHADESELLDHVKPLAGRVKKLFLVHGEGKQIDVFSDSLRGAGFGDVVIPERGQKFDLK